MKKKKKKQNYYEQFFKNDLNNLKNIWQSIRSLIAIKHSSASNICLLTHKGATVTDPLHISTIWNDNFSSVTEKLKPISNFQINHFKITFIILIESRYSKQRQMAHEVNLMIYSLNSDKSTGSNRFPTKILKLLKK